jgi:hypothetical protein
MMEITTIGLDLAKRIFQVHAANGKGEVVFVGRCAGHKCCDFLNN